MALAKTIEGGKGDRLWGKCVYVMKMGDQRDKRDALEMYVYKRKRYSFII